MKNKESYQKIVVTFLADSFPKDKKNRWGKFGLDIVRCLKGFALQYNGVILLYRGMDGKLLRRKNLYDFTEMVEGEAQLCSKTLIYVGDGELDRIEIFC
jgi:hypothetical protein